MDMNFLQQMLRLQNIFGNNPQGGPNGQDVISPGINGQPNVSQPYVNPAMAQPQGYTPNDTASKSYSDFLNQYPQEQPPSKMRQLGGFLAGFGAGVSPAGYEHGQAVGFKGNPKEAMQVSDAFANYPHDTAVNEWLQKAKPMQAAVAEEDKANANKRIAYEQDENRKVAQQKADESERQHAAQEADKEVLRARQQQDSNTRTFNSQINEYKVKHPNAVIKAVDGALIAIDPQTQEATTIKDSEGKPYETGKMSDADKLTMQLHNQLAEIHARTEGSKEVVGARVEGERSLIPDKLKASEELKATVPGKAPSSTGGTQTPTQDRVALINRAQQARIEHPEWAKYININGTNVVVTTPGRFSGPDPAVYDQISKYILGGKSSTYTPSHAGVNAVPVGGSMKREIKGYPGTEEESLDGGKTWKRIK